MGDTLHFTPFHLRKGFTGMFLFSDSGKNLHCPIFYYLWQPEIISLKISIVSFINNHPPFR